MSQIFADWAPWLPDANAAVYVFRPPRLRSHKALVGQDVCTVAVGLDLFDGVLPELKRFDERAIGFYSVVVAASSLVALIYYATTLLTPYGDDVQLSMIAATFFLAVPPAMVFSYYAIPAFSALQQVAGWFLLVGGIGVTTTGLVIVSTLIEARGFAR